MHRPFLQAVFCVVLVTWQTASASIVNRRPFRILSNRNNRPHIIDDHVETAKGVVVGKEKAYPPIGENDNTNNSINQLLQIRGGALLPKGVDVAKVATVISLLQGAVAFLNPSSMLKGYGMTPSSSTALAEVTMRRLGVLLVQMGILGVILFFYKDLGINTAIGAASLGMVVEIGRSLLQNEHRTIGFAAGPQIAVMIQCAAVSYINLMKLGSVVDIVNKINMAWVALNGCAFAFLPKLICTAAWGMESPDPKLLAMISGFGYWLIAYSIYLGALVLGIDPIQALTYNRIAILLIHVLPSPSGSSIGMDKTKQAVLFAYQALILAGLVAL